MSNPITDEISLVARSLEMRIRNGVQLETEYGLNRSGREQAYKLLDDLMACLFPGIFTNENIPKGELAAFLPEILTSISGQMKALFTLASEHNRNRENVDESPPEARWEGLTQDFINVLPLIRDMLSDDIDAAFRRDRSAHSADEVVLSYPCIEAIATYRLAHVIANLGIPLIPRIMSQRAQSRTGIDIHPSAEIGRRFFIDHGTGVVIGETSTIGNNVKIYQGVTLGSISWPDEKMGFEDNEKRHPDVEDDVIIYANAVILGGKTTIGKGAVIGGNTWITKSVPPGARVFNRKG
ncbi:serine O-acetyltransferase EpsC [Fibrobacterota bacterium]